MLKSLPSAFEKDSIKGIIFATLTKEYPLKLIDLMNIVRKRHGRSVTFQAVRKAVLSLVEQGMLEKREKDYRISKAWVRETKRTIDELSRELSEEKPRAKRVDAAGENVRVFTFASVNEMMKFWQDVIDDWFATHDGKKSLNCYQAAHLWECLLHLDREKKVMQQLKRKGIISYAVCASNTPLDRKTVKFYTDIGLKTLSITPQSGYDRTHYIATYGELVVEATYPEETARALDTFFRETTDLERLDLNELADIVNKKIPVKLTVIKNQSMAEHVNHSITSQFV